MGPIKCLYVYCTSTSETHSMFRFPTQGKERLKTWIENSGNIHLDLTKEQWQHRYLCEKHFDPESIHRNNQRDRLIGLANPWKHNYKIEVISSDSDTSDLNPSSSVFQMVVLPPRKVYEKRSCRTPKEAGSSSSQNSSQFKQDLSMPSSENQTIDNFCQNAKCVQRRILLQASRKTLQKQISQIAWFKEKLANENLHQRKFPSEASKIIAGMQFALRPEKRKWKDEEKRLSLALFDKSPACYRLMLSKGIVLPSVRTIERWLSESTHVPAAGDCGSPTEERNDDNNIMIEREDDGTNIKEEHEEDYVGMNELCEEDGARVKEEQEEHYEESVKEEFDEDSSESATAAAVLYAEHEIKCEFTLGPEQF